jgi:hypothetical protein
MLSLSKATIYKKEVGSNIAKYYYHLFREAYIHKNGNIIKQAPCLGAVTVSHNLI